MEEATHTSRAALRPETAAVVKNISQPGLRSGELSGFRGNVCKFHAADHRRGHTHSVLAWPRLCCRFLRAPTEGPEGAAAQAFCFRCACCPTVHACLPPVCACLPPLLAGVTCRTLNSHVSEASQACFHPAVMTLYHVRHWCGVPPGGPDFPHKPMAKTELRR